MEEKIQSLVKGRKPEEVEELNLDNVHASQFSGLGEELSGLKRLSVINVGLSTLEGLPKLPALERLELGDNKLAGGLERLADCPSLVHVSLVGNRVATLENLLALKPLKSLVSLDLLDCPVTRVNGYREKVFELLPSLTSLDGLTRQGEEVEESDSEQEEEEEADGDSDGGPGLDYLQRELGSGSSDDSSDYDPDAEGAPGDDDDVIPSSGEEGGPSTKKPRLDLDTQPQQSDSDSD